MWNDLKYYPTDILHNQMNDCLGVEDYMHCARIRDELARRKRTKSFNETITGKIVNFFIYVGAVILFIMVISWVMTSIGNWVNLLLR